MKSFKNILWGFVLVIVGIILGLKEFNVINFNIFFDGWWTLFIIVPCFIDLFSDKDKTGDIIGILIGLLLLLACLDLINFDTVLRLIFPAILVIIGLSFMCKDLFNRKINDAIKKLNENKSGNEIAATFGGQKISYDNEEFKGATFNAVFGGIDCDLRNSIIKNDVVINASSIFGGIDIKVPSDVKVIIKSSSIFGGVSDDRRKKEETEKSKVIYVNATCLFGGVDIK